MSPSPDSSPAGEIIDGAYRVDASLGAGGEGAVIRATRIADGAPVALKRLHLHRVADPEARTRFEREARALNGIEHPNIIRMLDFGFDAQGPYLVTELLPGGTLDALLARGALHPELALDLGIHITAGLAAAHAQGVIHRDIKPENVFVEQLADGRVRAKLLDFGLARFFDRERWADEASLTTEGAVLGTPLYMAPDQALGLRADTRSDVYSLGVVLFELLAGAPPFDGPNRMVLITAHLSAPVPALGSARAGLEVLPALDAVIQQALAKRPDDRPQDGGQLLAALMALPRPATRLHPSASRPGP